MNILSLRLVRWLFAVCLPALLIATVAAANPPIAAVNTENGVAIKGYDPVSYFEGGKPQLGLPNFSITYKGAVYRFASAEHRDRFIAMPEKFAPQYGGYCAYAISWNRIPTSTRRNGRSSPGNSI
jgi:YHS domain-containing protein